MCRCGGGSRRRWWAHQMGTNASRIFLWDNVVPLSGFGSHQRTVLCCTVLHSASALSAILSWPGTSGSLLQPSNLPYCIDIWRSSLFESWQQELCMLPNCSNYSKCWYCIFHTGRDCFQYITCRTLARLVDTWHWFWRSHSDSDMA